MRYLLFFFVFITLIACTQNKNSSANDFHFQYFSDDWEIHEVSSLEKNIDDRVVHKIAHGTSWFSVKQFLRENNIVFSLIAVGNAEDSMDARQGVFLYDTETKTRNQLNNLIIDDRSLVYFSEQHIYTLCKKELICYDLYTGIKKWIKELPHSVRKTYSGQEIWFDEKKEMLYLNSYSSDIKGVCHVVDMTTGDIIYSGQGKFVMKQSTQNFDPSYLSLGEYLYEFYINYEENTYQLKKIPIYKQGKEIKIKENQVYVLFAHVDGGYLLGKYDKVLTPARLAISKFFFGVADKYSTIDSYFFCKKENAEIHIEKKLAIKTNHPIKDVR